jgi:hypothetical protein
MPLLALGGRGQMGRVGLSSPMTRRPVCRRRMSVTPWPPMPLDPQNDWAEPGARSRRWVPPIRISPACRRWPIAKACSVSSLKTYAASPSPRLLAAAIASLCDVVARMVNTGAKISVAASARVTRVGARKKPSSGAAGACVSPPSPADGRASRQHPSTTSPRTPLTHQEGWAARCAGAGLATAARRLRRLPGAVTARLYNEQNGLFWRPE